MSDVPMKAIIGVNSEVQYVPLTPEEIQQRELDAIAWATRKAEEEAAAKAKADKRDATIAALAAATGVSADDIKEAFL